MNIVFEVINSGQIDFSEAMEKFTDSSNMEKSALAKAMLDCGFTIKSTLYTKGKSSTPTREYVSIICPIELPTYIVQKLIRSMLHANGGNRLGGAVTENDYSITEDPNVAVKGYWTKDKKGDTNTSSTTSSTPVVKTASTNIRTNSLPKVSQTPTPAVVQGPWAEKKKSQSSNTDDGTPKPPVIKGYWASKKEKPLVAGSLFDNDAGEPGEVITGYWSKKEDRKVGSLWDEEDE